MNFNPWIHMPGCWPHEDETEQATEQVPNKPTGQVPNTPTGQDTGELRNSWNARSGWEIW